MEALRARLPGLVLQAAAATQAYDRMAWARYMVIFIPIPFVVVMFRLYMQAWHYYLAGGLFLAIAIGVYAIDLAAANRRDEAARAVDRAQEALERARLSQAATGEIS